MCLSFIVAVQGRGRGRCHDDDSGLDRTDGWLLMAHVDLRGKR